MATDNPFEEGNAAAFTWLNAPAIDDSLTYESLREAYETLAASFIADDAEERIQGMTSTGIFVDEAADISAEAMDAIQQGRSTGRTMTEERIRAERRERRRERQRRAREEQRAEGVNMPDIGGTLNTTGIGTGATVSFNNGTTWTSEGDAVSNAVESNCNHCYCEPGKGADGTMPHKKCCKCGDEMAQHFVDRMFY